MPVSPRRAVRRSVAITVMLLLMPARGRAVEAALTSPETADVGGQLTVEVSIDVGTRALGSYGLTLVFDSAVLSVGGVTGGRTTGYDATPTSNVVCSSPPSTLCDLRIAAFGSAQGMDRPTGNVSVARVGFNVVATKATVTDIGLRVRSVFDSQASRIDTGASATGRTVRLVNGAPRK